MSSSINVPRWSARPVGKALERFWERREEAKEIGATAAERIRQLVPPDPVRIFADKIRELLSIVDSNANPGGTPIEPYTISIVASQNDGTARKAMAVLRAR